MSQDLKKKPWSSSTWLKISDSKLSYHCRHTSCRQREEDERYKAEVEYEAGEVEMSSTLDKTPNTEATIFRGVHSSTLDWDDLKRIREAWGSSGPVVLKGIQTAEDAKQAADLGVEGVYLSNHSGRQTDHGPSSIRTLLEIRKFCPEILAKVDIYLDGGIRRGADILKALCLGATLCPSVAHSCMEWAHMELMG
jgi:L-lactate dehydrogenase (cytochrome)